MQFTAENTILKSMSFSFGSNYKKTSIKHNERTPEDKGKLKDFGKHIHWDKTAENEVLVSKPIKEVYKDVFQKSVDEYNQKQRRKDRRIKNFYSKMRKDKSYDAQKEFIVQVGKKGQQLSDDPKKNDELQKDVLETYLKKFEDAYPQLHVYSAVVHVDEASPHMHLAVVPEATGYKRGVAKKPSFSKAMGITNQETFKAFCEANRDLLQQSVREVLGVEVKREKVGTHAYLPPEQYRELMSKADEKVQKAQDTLDDAKDEADEIIFKAKAEAEKIASDAKTKADANREVMQYRASEMSKVDREVEAEKSKKRSQVDRELVTYRTEKKSQVDNALKTYSDKKKKEADADADKIRNDATVDASLILSDAKRKRTDAVARETKVAGREADISAREAILQENESKYTDDLKELQKRQQELEKKKKKLQAWRDDLEEREKRFSDQVREFWKRAKSWGKSQLEKLVHKADEEEHSEEPTEDLLSAFMTTDLDQLHEAEDRGFMRK